MSVNAYAVIKTAAIYIGITFVLSLTLACTGSKDGEIKKTEASINPVENNKNTITKKEIYSYFHSGPNVYDMWGKTIVLGVHNGMHVIAEHPCSDVCPDYTKRVIRYDITLKDCVKNGGVTKIVYIPYLIGSARKEYCVPKILTGHQ